MIVHLTTVQPAGKIIFSINNRARALAIKKELKQLGRHARYVEIKNTATIIHNQLIELQGDIAIIDDEAFVTRAVQPIEELSARDYGRPASDAKSGMLPPKLARVMINLARVPDSAVILDPFCGSGTILAEAAAMGYNKLAGSDISPKALGQVKQNMEWLKRTYALNAVRYTVYQSDARKLHTILKPNSIDAIITEPYLGIPLTGRETETFLKKQADELEKLYFEAIASLANILKAGGVMIIITPAFATKHGFISVNLSASSTNQSASMLKKIGLIADPLLPDHPTLRYHRPGQHVARDIWRLAK